MTAKEDLREFKRKAKTLPEQERNAAFASDEFKQLVGAVLTSPQPTPRFLCFGHCNSHCNSHTNCGGHCFGHQVPVVTARVTPT
jgi:hypothetical protein